MPVHPTPGNHPKTPVDSVGTGLTEFSASTGTGIGNHPKTPVASVGTGLTEFNACVDGLKVTVLAG